MTEKDLAALICDQDGVVTRKQVIEHGGKPADIERRLRRREWVRLLPGVFLDHTGEPTWQQRAWAGVLYYAPAALAERSALRAESGPGWRRHDDSAPIRIIVDEDRNVVRHSGYAVRRTTRLDDKVQWNRSPPRLRTEEALLDLAGAAATDLDAVAILTDACQSRWTTAQRLVEALDHRTRLRRRRWLREVLRDIHAGTCSVLEHGYLTRVERPHGLPEGARQAPARSSGRTVFRDVDYAPFPMLVELDGRPWHDGATQRDRDLDRDLEAAVDGRLTVRLGWGQVYDRPCLTAGRVGRLLVTRGWQGPIVRCGPACVAA